MHDVIKLSLISSPSADVLVGSAHETRAAYYGGGETVYYLGESYPIRGTLTAAIRDFNLPTARAPGDWPEPSANGTVRY